LNTVAGLTSGNSPDGFGRDESNQLVQVVVGGRQDVVVEQLQLASGPLYGRSDSSP
jgi:hypothetical protein